MACCGCLPKFNKKWRVPQVMWWLMGVELLGTVAVLALFGMAEPNTFRTTLWQVGYDNQFNSSPKQILYAYANHRPIPKIPFVWSGMLTQFNVAIAVLSTFVLLCKAAMYAMHVWYPILGTITNAALTALYLVSVYGQAGPDKSDPRYPSNSAWYITKSCDYAKPSGNDGHCRMAKGTFAATVIMATIFFINMALGIWSLIPTAAQRAAAKIEFDDMQVSEDGSPSTEQGDRRWEMKTAHVQATPATPYTPRTLAFNTLDRQLPLREPAKARWT